MIRAKVDITAYLPPCHLKNRPPVMQEFKLESEAYALFCIFCHAALDESSHAKALERVPMS